MLASRALARRSSSGDDRRAGAPRFMTRATNPVVIANAILLSSPAELEDRHGLAVIVNVLGVGSHQGLVNNTLLISAADDLYGTFPSTRYTAEHIPGARFVGYPTGGHLLLGHWKEACAQVAEFLSSPVR